MTPEKLKVLHNVLMGKWKQAKCELPFSYQNNEAGYKVTLFEDESVRIESEEDGIIEYQTSRDKWGFIVPGTEDEAKSFSDIISEIYSMPKDPEENAEARERNERLREAQDDLYTKVEMPMFARQVGRPHESTGVWAERAEAAGGKVKLAKELGVSLRSINRYEREEMKMSKPVQMLLEEFDKKHGIKPSDPA